MGLVFSWLWGRKEAPPLLDVATESQVIPPAEAPVVAPAEIEIQTADATVIKTETEQMLDVCEPEAVEVEAEALTEENAVAKEEEEEVEVAVSEDITIPETVAAEEQVVEAEQVVVSAEVEPAAHEVVTDTVVEVVTEISEPEQEVTEPAAAAPAEEDEGEVDVVAEEEAPEVPAEPDATTEDAPIQYVEIPVVADTISEAPVEEAAAPLTEATEVIADTLVDDFVVTEPLSAVEVAIAESAAVQQEIVVMNDTLSTITESTDVTPPEPEPAAAPAEEMVTDVTAEQTCLDMLSEEPKSEICDMPCQMQLAVETAEMSVETGLNAHIVPEVSIEG
ncbi:uncharacterized protein LOC114441574 isoform X3 [Parambassis ranga]|uniref:Uncharacterized protein LOC114441574 isoform X3 n=1 Tax=Parambassis ranga TaxID=210632 RepID=A0A6P7J1A3_9TELE|nr:uncharacterized protein LOC114441574 isoform X3 [Parambassis ranga]